MLKILQLRAASLFKKETWYSKDCFANELEQSARSIFMPITIGILFRQIVKDLQTQNQVFASYVNDPKSDINNPNNERPFEFRFALRIIPIKKVVPTTLEDIKAAASELTKRIGEKETYRVTVEKRFTELHSADIINAVASDIPNKADLTSPNKILLIETLGALTGLSIVKPQEIISVQKEKML
jgi:tRNA(Ser,Leu) C12 N-acetylase TAN1